MNLLNPVNPETRLPIQEGVYFVVYKSGHQTTCFFNGTRFELNEEFQKISTWYEEGCIDAKIKELQDITTNFLFIEYYSHSQCQMFKIDSEFTKYQRDIIVLCPVSDGIANALDLAIEHLGKAKAEFSQTVENCL